MGEIVEIADLITTHETLDKQQMEQSNPMKSSSSLINKTHDNDNNVKFFKEAKNSFSPDNIAQFYDAEEFISNTDDDEEFMSEFELNSGEDEICWVAWFCNLRGNEFFCQVDDIYILDEFNLHGLNNLVPYFDYALDLILDVESSIGDSFTEEQDELVGNAAELLYGLIHARYILTSPGMAAMLEKYEKAEFGTCPRVNCSGQHCLPIGQSDVPGESTVKIYCPNCEDIYNPKSRYQDNVDGAYFGTTFPHIFLMTYEHHKPQKGSQRYVTSSVK